MKYRKKPIVVEAFRMGIDEMPKWFIHKLVSQQIFPCTNSSGQQYCDIVTLEGMMRAEYGDYVIKGVKGECYPCKPDIFEQSYELVEG